MCRAAKVCSELGLEQSNWNLSSPLKPPQEFSEVHALFLSSYSFACDGNLELAIETLRKTNDGKIRDWYVEHGQMSGFFRLKALGSKSAPKYFGELDPNTSITNFETQVYERDGFKCAYCGNDVVHTRILKRMETLVGPESFRTSGTNAERHGTVFILRATADHVVPISRGGRTELSNLVTSCWSCNYGKSSYTLEEIGLKDPRSIKDTLKA